ncbi:MAG: hypothetical protein MUO38_04350 [Anaerolineales bacterium]|nr:hypothetical protein [Anaerolineales bacterium]
MKWYQFDWNRGSTQRILVTLADSLRDLESELDASKEQYQIDDALDRIESLLGISFVVAQGYVTSVVAAARKLSPADPPISKEEVLGLHNETIPGTGITRLELCDAMANYFKHHDEWPAWNHKGPHHKTVAVLQAVGIDQLEVTPCIRAVEMLFPSSESDELNKLYALITGWRDRVIQSVAPDSSAPSA